MTQRMDEKWYAHGEATTGHGQVVRFMAPGDRREAVEAFLRENVASIEIPEDRPVGQSNVGHGTYGRYSRYDIHQHKYAGGGYPGSGGFIELLEIRNAPEGRCNVVIHEDRSYPRRCSFSEWASVKQAMPVYERAWGRNWNDCKKIYHESPGFIRIVPCGYLTPWFYAVGDQELCGDYAIVPGWHNDTVYRLGEPCVVFDAKGFPSIKTCMGSRVFQKESEHYPHKQKEVRVIQWHDGTYWSSDTGYGGTARPRPLEEEETWIMDAMEQFRELLSGERKKISVEFSNGMRFTGSFRHLRRQRHTREGRYDIIVHVKGEEESRNGWIDFNPTQECPDVPSYIRKKLGRQKEIKILKIERCGSSGGQGPKRLWAGVFHDPPKDI